MSEQKDARLWKQAKARAGFKIHFTVYAVVMLVLWGIWFATGGGHIYPWPLWPMFGWGIGVLFDYFSAFKFGDATEQEYEKLKRQSTEARM